MLVLQILMSLACIFLLCGIGYIKKGWFVWLYHDKLNWHVPKENSIITDGFTQWGICRFCDEVIQQDSQGNWF